MPVTLTTKPNIISTGQVTPQRDQHSIKSNELYTPPVCTGFHRFPSDRDDWRTYLQSGEYAQSAPVMQTIN